ncbi:MAG: hypothetical protein ACK5OC_28045 [Pirellula sp.]
MTTVLIQHVHTLWTKKSRGSDGARLRNTVPLAVELPPQCACDSRRVMHLATYSEWTQFERSDRNLCVSDFKKLDIRDLDILIVNDELQIRYHRDGNNAARTSPLPFTDLPAIKLNEWIRLRYNGRYVHRSTGNWWYEQSCYNIGWFDSFDADVFLTTSPINRFEEIAVLH